MSAAHTEKRMWLGAACRAEGDGILRVLPPAPAAASRWQLSFAPADQLLYFAVLFSHLQESAGPQVVVTLSVHLLFYLLVFLSLFFSSKI